MKKKIIIILVLGFSLLAAGAVGRHFLLNNNLQTGYYTCSMHPQVRENKSGRCPICGMNLTYVENNKDHTEHNHQQEMRSMVDLTNKQVKNFHSSVFEVQRKNIVKALRLLGRVVQSEKRQSNIPARIAGRVEKVYINSTGSFVSKNDPVVDIYSPELIAAGEEYLISYKSGQKDLLVQAKKKLKLLGVKEFQLINWLKNRVIPRNITIYSDVGGIVTTKNAVEGKYFEEGQSFYDLVNLSSVWVEMDVYENDAGLIKIGQEVDIEFIAHKGEKWTTNVDFISPILDENTRTLKIRATLNNKEGKLKPGMVGEIHIAVDSVGEVLVVPNSAIIDTGKREIVWVQKGSNNYEATEIQTGIVGEQFTEVKFGLDRGDLVVVKGNFLLDAQSKI